MRLNAPVRAGCKLLGTLCNLVPERADLHLSPLVTKFVQIIMQLCLSVLTTLHLNLPTKFAPERADLHLFVLVTKLLLVVMQILYVSVLTTLHVSVLKIVAPDMLTCT